MKKTMHKILAVALVLMMVLAMLPAAFAAALISPAPMKLDFWVSDANTYAVTTNDDGTYKITYNGGGSTYACAGAPVADYANGNDTLTVTVTNNGAADSRVRFDVQATTQVGNTQTCNVSATGGDVWTDLDWGGSTLTVPAGQTVTVTVTYDANSERGAVTNLVVFVDSGRGDGETYSADVTLSGISFTTAEPEVPTDPAAIVEAAFALEQGASLPYQPTLTGTVTEIVKFNEKYGDVNLNFEVEGRVIYCYGLKGDGVADLKAGDVISVTGTVKNYKGTIEFDKPTFILVKAAMTPAQILEAAYALEKGAAFTDKASLTGTITKVNTAYSEQFKNITVTIVVDGHDDKPMMCYRLKGDGAADLKEGDVITVTGTIKNYNGTIEFDSGCTFVMVKAADPVEPGTPDEPGEVTVPATLAEQIAEANKLANNALLPYESTITGTITDEPLASSKTEGSYRFTVTDGTNTIMCYFVPVSGGAPKQGDTITVTGKLTAYNGKAQFSEKNSTAVLAPSDPDPIDPPAPTGTTYVVKAGDTLGKIALAHYGIVEKYQAIFEANRGILTNPNMIYVGQVLTLPGENLLTAGEGETLYTIQPGDTLGKIALNWYGTMSQYKAIFERNATHLANPDLIYAGQVIVLPAK